MDDGTYVANIKYLFDRVYDNEYFALGDIWRAEHLLNHRKIERFIMEQPLYRRYNVVGKNDWDSSEEKARLNQQFGVKGSV